MMNQISAYKLARLERLPLSTIWHDESLEFTPWLAEDANLSSLAEELQLRLAFQGREKRVGPFRADLVCKDLDKNRIVIIENQLTRSDHRHFGQLMTYAAGLDAFSLVWISEHFSPEHCAAIDWLNDMTAEGIDFYAVELELYRIANSPVALKFNLVCKPNVWRKRGPKFREPNGDMQSAEVALKTSSCLKTMLDHVTTDRRLKASTSVSDLLRSAANLSNSVPMKDAEKVLSTLGLRVAGRGETADVYIANRHDGLERIFLNTRWTAGGWRAVLKEIDGVAPGGSRTFNRSPARTLKLPLSKLFRFEQLNDSWET